MLRHVVYKRNEKDFATKVVEDDVTGAVTQYVGDNPVVTAQTNPVTGGSVLSAGGDEIVTSRYTLAQVKSELPAAPAGRIWLVTDVGGGIYMTKAASGLLKPVNNVAVINDIVSPVTFPAGVTQRIYAEFLIPAGLLVDGSHFQIDPVFSKSGTTDAMTMNIAMSATPGSVGTTISQTATMSILLAGNRRAQGSLRFQRLSATTLGNTVTNTTGGSGINLASGGAYAALTVPSMEANTYLQVCGTASGSTDTVQLESCLLTMYSKPI